MGAAGSKKGEGVIKESTVVAFEYGVCPGDCVQHYLPPNFPMLPNLNSAYLMDCNKTWKLICTANTDRMRQYGKSGIVLYYDEFFYRLFQRDTTMEEVFPDIKKRSEVLIKAMTFILKSATDNNEQVISRCNFLGHRHKTFSRVRPHHFANYTSCAIEVIMYWLGEYATADVGEAWSNVVGFMLKHLLSSYLYDKLDPYESYQNTTISAVKEIVDSRGEQSERTSARSDQKRP